MIKYAYKEESTKVTKGKKVVKKEDKKKVKPLSIRFEQES